MTPDTCRKTSSGFFGFALFCFFLPFVTFSCPGMETTLTGAQLVIETDLEGERIGGVVAIAALVFIACALVLTFLPRRNALAGATLVGASGALCLVLLGLILPPLAQRQADGVVTVGFEFGYWLALAGVAAAVVLGYRAATEGEGRAGAPGARNSPDAGLRPQPGQEGEALTGD